MSATRLLPRFCREHFLRVGVCAWLLLSAAGLGLLFQYARTPGEIVAAPGEWPSNSSIERAANEQTLVMFVHPHCPCTRASLAELERVVAQSGGDVRPRIVFSLPAGATPGWEHSDLWTSAGRVHGAVLIVDVDSREAERFGARVSGTTLLYDTNGKLSFRGGITAGRGHQGDNTGEIAVVNLLHGDSSGCSETFAFGCPIQPSAITDQVEE